MNFIAGILVVVVCTYVGFGYDSYYVSKLNIMKEFCIFIDFAIAEIGYLRTDLLSLFRKYDNIHNSSLSFAMLEMKNLRELSEDDIKINLLSSREKQMITAFIKDISRLSTDGQKAFAQEYKLRVHQAIKYIEEEERRKSKLVKKLAPLLGLGIMILII